MLALARKKYWYNAAAEYRPYAGRPRGYT